MHDKEDVLDAEAVRREAARLSDIAYAESLVRYPNVEIVPPHGPLEKVVPPKATGDMIPNKYHIVVPVDSQDYQGWQVLTHYWWYRRLKEQHPDSPMGGYTRLLHSDEPDSLMHLVPTLRVNLLPENITGDYSPMHRSWAYVQWLLRFPVREQYVMMSDPDHLFQAPPPLLATPTALSTFPFGYISCTQEQTLQLCKDPRFNPQRVAPELVPPIGSSPMIISTEMMIDIVPKWDSIMRAIHADEEAVEGFGWVQEMYAFALAAASPNGTNVLLHRCMMNHPPYDQHTSIDVEQVGSPVACQKDGEQQVPVAILHYTYGNYVDANGKLVEKEDAAWSWDKREYSDNYPALPMAAPPEGSPESVSTIVSMINEAGQSPELWQWWRANMGPPQ